MVLLNALIKSHIYYCIVTLYSCISVSFQISVFQCDWFSLWLSIFENYSSKKEPTGLIRLPDRFMASTKRKNGLTRCLPQWSPHLSMFGDPLKGLREQIAGSPAPPPSPKFLIQQVCVKAWPPNKFLNEPNATDSELSEPLTHKLKRKSLKALLFVD